MFIVRADNIIKILEDSNADIIGLQEVIPRFLKKLLTCKWVRDSYYITETTGDSFCGYGNIIMSTLRPSAFYTRPLESLMGRQLVMGEFRLTSPAGNPHILRIGCVHLESLSGNHELRNFQFKQIAPALLYPVAGTKVHAILMGDFNLDPESQEEIDSVKKELPEFSDCWVTCNNNIPGPTRFVNYPENGKHPVRYDRILTYSTRNIISPAECNTFGSSKIDIASKSEKYDTVFPSDHLGLSCNLEFHFKTKSI